MKIPRHIQDALDAAEREGRIVHGQTVNLPTDVVIRAVPLPLDVSEAEFATWVIQAAQDRLWRVAHFRPAQTSKGWRTAVQGDGKGFPDLVLVKSRLIFAELKAEKGILAQDQKDWLYALMSANQPYFVWRPRDQDDILRILEQG